jgi:pyruvate/2-oxoglutarate dehydrogenase complex dihydrolipoamide dehydrogenase (E3) component
MYTSNPYIQAIGDCANKIDFFTGNDSNIMLASVAAREGRIAASNLFKRNLPLEPIGTINLFSTALGKTYFGAAGLTEEKALKLGYTFKTININTTDKHPAALPETNQIKGKFIFNGSTGVLLGAQLQGGNQIAELINLLGMIIQQKIPADKIFNNLYGTHPLGTSSPNKYIIHAASRKMIASYFNN